MISFIVAYDKNRVIGKGNKLPWHLPSDLTFFKKVTTGHTIVMGRHTYESIGHALPNRRNIVFSRNADFHPDDAEVMNEKEEILQIAEQEEVFIIGGAQLFHLFLPDVVNLYITKIDAEFEGDTFFPDWDLPSFDLICQLKGEVDKENPYPHTFYIYQKSLPHG
ncbi:dihydrofolate reductase [Seinonella peptonophila]|uniref:Dihydrofolate reductase n=1 Tax=Seinonella peptonophila TaxID=112248 RepID=A0A1M4WL54_9BACL|nr:dihydrofolate reductase [Seinonella peptonophila]SHE81924.1 dihydrofolate reductase [Seinonella peptonophila]